MCEHGRFHRVRGLLVALAGALLLARPTPLAASPPDAVGQLHSTACFAPSADPSAKPLQLVSHIRLDRRAVMLLYTPFFAHTLFLKPKVGLAEEFEEGGAEAFDALLRAVPSHYDCFVDSHAFDTATHWCLGGLFAALLGPQPEGCPGGTVAYSGALYHHLDMWVNPRRLLAPPFDRGRAWLPRLGLPHADPALRGHRCASGAALARDCWGWGWCEPRAWERNGSVQATGAWDVARARAALPALAAAWPPGRLCRGHADVAYTPARLMAHAASVARFFRATDHEVALHTVLEMAAALGGDPPGAFVDTACDGSCCEPAGPDLAAYNCAHRLDLADGAVRRRVARALLAAGRRGGGDGGGGGGGEGEGGGGGEGEGAPAAGRGGVGGGGAGSEQALA